MRQIGTIASEREARVFADHLLARGITSKLVPDRDGGSAVWVHNEDHVPGAAEEFRAFVQAPDDPRYQASREAAREARRAAEKAEKDHRKNTRDLRARWEGSAWGKYPLTIVLIVGSVAVSLLTNFGHESGADLMAAAQNRPTLLRSLLFSDYSLGIDLTREVPTLRLDGHGFNDIRRGQVWRLVTPIFIHFDPMHLVFNVLAFRFFGGTIELRRGWWRLLILVLVSAIASNAGECLIELQSRSVTTFGGMSGVVYALFGYLWMKGFARPEEGLGVSPNTVWTMLIWFLLCFTGMFGPVANAAHGVGLAAGMAFGLSRF